MISTNVCSSSAPNIDHVMAQHVQVVACYVSSKAAETAVDIRLSVKSVHEEADGKL